MFMVKEELMNNYKIYAIAEKKEIKMIMPFYIQAHSIQSAYSKAVNYIKEEENENGRKIRHKMEIVKIEKV